MTSRVAAYAAGPTTTLLGVVALPEAREADQIRKQDRGDLAFANRPVAGGRARRCPLGDDRGHRCAARRTEPRAVWQLCATARTARNDGHAAGRAEPRAR